jgi:5-formyltetrahydrofolate cyclo-ligase
MVARAIGSLDDLVPGKFGIPAPREGLRNVERDEIDLMLVPAVAFDEEGRRLGRGGGYYDRYLSGFAGPTVGLAREKLLCPAVPTEPHEMRVRFVVTESRVIKTA